MVRQVPITSMMKELMHERKWMMHFDGLVEGSKFPQLQRDPVVPKLQRATVDLAAGASTFHRQSLQTRFFETGDNYYLGMEFTREYEDWKRQLAADLVYPLTIDQNVDQKDGALNGFKVIFTVVSEQHIEEPRGTLSYQRLFLISL
jgi:hypothetical protein